MHLADVQRQPGTRRLGLPRRVAGNGEHGRRPQAALDCRDGQGRRQDDPQGRADLGLAALAHRPRQPLSLASNPDQETLEKNKLDFEAVVVVVEWLVRAAHD